MEAQCPHCDTIFRLTDEQLTVANGKVRCGFCQNVFSALSETAPDTAAEIIEAEPEVATEAEDESPADDPLAFGETVFDDDSFTDDNIDGKIQIHSSEEETQEDIPLEAQSDDEPFEEDYSTEETSPIEEPSENESTEEVAFEDSHNEQDEDILFNEDNNKIIPDEYRSFDQPVNHSSSLSIYWSIGVVILLFSLISEYAWFNRNYLAHNPNTEKWITQFCNVAGCKIAPAHKPDLIKMVNRNIYTHPNIKKALMITATMVNEAPQAQIYPDLEIAFSNVRGKVIIQRTFTPKEYMKIDTAQLKLLQPNQPISFGIEIQDPGKQAITYEFNFL